ncbi:MAG: hypothetical protein P4L28_00660 [Paludibacteraceae bacterium]|nr:hypothetical protein [Paludibacteraceae bacterium]
MRDFTLPQYTKLLNTFLANGYTFQTFEQFIQSPAEKVIVLRHDVDLKAVNSLKTAEIEHQLGIAGSYYFRVIPQSNNPEVISKIVGLGHEIGYHYEDLSLFKGDFLLSIHHFEKQLNHFRCFYPVKTICMHGSPMSKIDNRSLWNKYNYRDFGIIGEPYFDVDFNAVLYLTDTGCRWDGARFSVRDKVNTPFAQTFRTTDDIIAAITAKALPSKIMVTVHPQRWTDNYVDWVKELLLQNLKNTVKSFLI